MVICFQCSPRTKDRIDALVQQGLYPGIGQVIESAVENLVVLHAEVAESQSGAVMLAGDHLSHTPSQLTRAVPGPSLQLDSASAIGVAVDDRIPRGSDVPIERWLWGQFNRILPVKVTCRVVAAMLAESPSGVTVEAVQEAASKSALRLGAHLKRLDEVHGRNRDDAHSVAFPLPGKGQAKSILRFSTQFAVSRQSQGRLGGLPTELKLLGPVSSEDRIALTSAGVEFAELANPLLDGASEGASTARFTDTEIEYLVAHIAEHVWVEEFAYLTLLAAVAAGHREPETLDDFLIQTANPNVGRGFVATQRTGAISRMADLGLVERTRQGPRIVYRITPRGHDHLIQAGGIVK